MKEINIYNCKDGVVIHDKYNQIITIYREGHSNGITVVKIESRFSIDEVVDDL